MIKNEFLEGNNGTVGFPFGIFEMETLQKIFYFIFQKALQLAASYRSICLILLQYSTKINNLITSLTLRCSGTL